jgi:hypothetical protein
VSRNTADAELKALGLTTIQTVWLRGFLKELGCKQLEPTIIYVDNIAAKYLAESLDNISNNVGHLVVELNNIKERVLNGIIEIKYINTDDQVADILTKPLASKQFNHLKHYLLN